MGLKEQFNRIVLDSVIEYSLTLEEVIFAASSKFNGSSYVLVSYGKGLEIVKTEFLDCELDIFEDDEQEEVLCICINPEYNQHSDAVFMKISCKRADEMHIPSFAAIIPYRSYRINHFIFTKSQYKKIVESKILKLNVKV